MMTNEYSVTIHDYITDKIAAVGRNKKAAEKENDLPTARYCEGQLQELNLIRQYLNEKIDLKTQKYF